MLWLISLLRWRVDVSFGGCHDHGVCELDAWLVWKLLVVGWNFDLREVGDVLDRFFVIGIWVVIVFVLLADFVVVGQFGVILVVQLPLRKGIVTVGCLLDGEQ